MCFQIRIINAETDITLTIDIIDKTSVINYCTSKKSRTNNLLSLKQSTNNKLKWCEKSLDRDGVKQPIDEKLTRSVD